jgi:SAM-dependent methyltransferase
MSAEPPLPWEFEPDVYRQFVPELARLGDEDLAAHYNESGKLIGIPGNHLQVRAEFAALVPADRPALEIGPFGSPVLKGRHVRYCDVLSTEQLRERAPGHGVDPASVPDIHYVMANCSLDDIPHRFDSILSSHAIEHQPDLVAHLQQVERRLAPEGRYFILCPDKRFCFDRNLAPSTLAEVLQAHHERRKVHTLRSVVEHRAYGVHNDPARHWDDDRPPAHDSREVDAQKVAAALREYEQAAGGYIDVHAWYFTPDSFRQLMRLLHELGLTRLQVERLYRTRRNSVEFWAVLCERPAEGGPFDAATWGPETHESLPVAPQPSPRGGLLGRAVRNLLRG